MRSKPEDLADADVARCVSDGWGVSPVSVHYMAVGGGGYHWRFAVERGAALFVTVDDLTEKDWLGYTADDVMRGLDRALKTAVQMRDAGLDFIVAPLLATDGEPARRVGPRYAVSVYPFLDGYSFGFGPHTDSKLRAELIAMVAAIHISTSSLAALPQEQVPAVGARDDLEAVLAEPERAWAGGPFSAPAQLAVRPHIPGVRELLVAFDRLVAATAGSELVVTHGEPHAANTMRVAGRLLLFDFDTIGMAHPERDLSLLVTDTDPHISVYQDATGRTPDPTAISLYRLRWCLDDLARTVRLFTHSHQSTADAQRAWDQLPPLLDRADAWRDTLAQ